MKSNNTLRRGLAIATVGSALPAPAASAAPIEQMVPSTANGEPSGQPAPCASCRSARTTASTGATPESVRAACSPSRRSPPVPWSQSGTAQTPATPSRKRAALRRRRQPYRRRRRPLT